MEKNISVSRRLRRDGRHRRRSVTVFNLIAPDEQSPLDEVLGVRITA